MPDKKISDFEVFDASPNNYTAFVASSGNPKLSSATNVRFPFPTLSESILKYIGGGYVTVSGDSDHAYFGTIDPLDDRSTVFYTRDQEILSLDTDESVLLTDFLVDKNITSSGEFHSESGYFGPTFIGSSGIFSKLGVGITSQGVVESNPSILQLRSIDPSITFENLAAGDDNFTLFNSSVRQGYGLERDFKTFPDLYFGFDGKVGFGTGDPKSQFHIMGGDETLTCKHGKFGETLTVDGNHVITGLDEVYAEIDITSGTSIARDAHLQHEISDFSDRLLETGQLLLGEKPSISATDGSISNNLTVGGSITVGGEDVLTTSDMPGIATSSAVGLIKVNGGGLSLDSDGQISIDTVSTPSFWTSDSRLKENLKSIKDPLNTVLSMKGLNFTWKNNGYNSLSNTDDIGLIAQELEKVFPIAVGEQPDGMMGIYYHRLFPILIESIKELSSKVSNLESQIKNLK